MAASNGAVISRRVGRTSTSGALPRSAGFLPDRETIPTRRASGILRIASTKVFAMFPEPTSTKRSGSAMRFPLQRFLPYWAPSCIVTRGGVSLLAARGSML